MTLLFTDAPWNLSDQRTEASKLPFSNLPATTLSPSFQVILNQDGNGDKVDDEIFDFAGAPSHPASLALDCLASDSTLTLENQR